MSCRLFALIFSFTLIGQWAYGHARLVAPAPRSSNSGLKAGPCGNIAKGAPLTTLTAGQQYLVRFEETINHTGYFWIDLALDDQSLVNYDPNDPANNSRPNVWTLSPPPPENIPDNINRGTIEYMATIPANVTCENCTLRMVQYMENSAQPFYFSCADVRILAEESQSSTAALPPTENINTYQPAFGCGKVSAGGPGSGPGSLPVGLALFFLPLALLTYLGKISRITLRR